MVPAEGSVVSTWHASATSGAACAQQFACDHHWPINTLACVSTLACTNTLACVVIAGKAHRACPHMQSQWCVYVCTCVRMSVLCVHVYACQWCAPAPVTCLAFKAPS